jgi:hypothetical protein
MAQSKPDIPPQTYLHSLRGYVCSPIRMGIQEVEGEVRELKSEKNAFEEFIEEIMIIETEQPDNQTVWMQKNDYSQNLDRVRLAYQNTVMSTTHYSDTYGESLFENIKAEFSSEIAHALRSNNNHNFTPRLKQTLITGSEQRIAESIQFVERLEMESESLNAALGDLTELIDSLDSTRVPEWYQETFTGELKQIAADRQEMLTSMDSTRYVDYHELCEYLYESCPWTYPILISIARFRESIRI